MVMQSSPPRTARGGAAGLVRLSLGLSSLALSWMLPSTAATAVLLPAVIARASPHDKVHVLALATAAGAVAALVGSFVFGVLSDGTRSRFGPRNPWIVGGGLCGAGCLLVLARTHSVAGIVLWWALFQASLNMIVAPSAAVVPDRVPSARRGTVSAVIGSTLALAQAGGTLWGARFLSQPGTGLTTLAAVVVALPLLFAVLAPERGNREAARPARRSWSTRLRPPTHAPDFYWALIARLLLILGFATVTGYLLYILTDYIHQPAAQARATISEAAVIGLLGALASGVVTGPISDRTGRRKLPVMVSSLLIAIGAAMPFLAPRPWTVLAFAGIAGLGFGIYTSVDAALLTEVLPSGSSRGRDLAVLNIANTGGQVIAPTVTSLVVDVSGGYRPVFLASMGFCALAALAVLPIRRVR